MPFLHGAVVSAGLKYRFIIALLLVYILYSQWRHNNDLFTIIEKAGNDLTLCQNYAESLVAKLRVVYDHKLKMEQIYNSKRISNQGKRKVAEHLWQLCEENLTSITAELDQCRSGKRDQIPLPDLSGTVLLHRLQGEVDNLRAVNVSLNEVILEKEESIQVCHKELVAIKNSLSSCQEMVKKYVGVSDSLPS
ncbi:outer membrane insertion signal domain protein [Ostertagia ostertagi]